MRSDPWNRLEFYIINRVSLEHRLGEGRGERRRECETPCTNIYQARISPVVSILFAEHQQRGWVSGKDVIPLDATTCEVTTEPSRWAIATTCGLESRG